MFTLPLAIICTALFLLCIVLVFRCIDLYAAKFDGMYVDITGVRQNPPEYIDVVKRKTMNVRIDDEFTIHIPQVSFIDGVYRIREIQSIFLLLRQQSEDKTALKINEKNLQEFLTFCSALATVLYSLSYTFVKRSKRKKYFRVLKTKMLNDIEWTCELIEQVIDFWSYIKKKVQYLSLGSSLRQMHGADASWDCISWGTDGSSYLLPRFGKSLSTTGSQAKSPTSQN